MTMASSQSVLLVSSGNNLAFEGLHEELLKAGSKVRLLRTGDKSVDDDRSSLETAIDAAEVILIEMTDLQAMSLFAAGCALAWGKKTHLCLDTSNPQAVRLWRETAILPSACRIDYDGSLPNLLGGWYQRDDEQSQQLLVTLLAGGRPREADAVFAPSVPVKFQAARVLEKFLERQAVAKIIGAGDDLGIAPLDFYVKEVYRASAAILHLLSPRAARSAEHNLRVFFIAGVVRGFQIPLLLVVEGVFPPDARFGDCGHIYSSPIGLQEHVEAWLEDLPTAPGTNRRLGRLNLRVELPIQSFGQYVAEYEKDELSDYFVQTSQFRAVIDGTATVFVGRKGTGKTATMSQAVEELRKDRRNLVVAVKPTSYEFGAMTELLAAMPGDLAGEYLMLSVWNYLLYTEIGLRALSFASEQPARGGANLELQALESELGELGAWPDEDISVRLERLLDQLRREEKRDGESSQQFVSRALKLQRLGALRSHITSTLRTFDRVAVLLDNLDKTWERGADYRTLSRFILALLTTIGRVQKEFAREEAKGSSFTVSLAVFLRTDIHDALAVHAREPDKIDVRVVQWHDEELLSRVLEERFAAKRTSKRTDLNLWADLFDTEVRGLETRDYLMWRILPRPRDFVFLANAALTTALDRQHAIIKSSDILFAEKIYSRFAVDALMVEGDAESFDLEEVLYGFTGLDSTLSETELRSAIGDESRWEAVRDWLIQTSFLGVEVQPGEFRHVEGRREARKVSKLGERYARRVGGDVMFRIHPAFRADLDVRDDDLHDADIKDVTLDSAGAD